MRSLFKTFLMPLFASIIVTTIIGMFFSTQRVISQLNGIGGNVSFGERVSMTFFDLHHFGSLFIIFVSIALLVAFAMASWFARKSPNLRKWIFVVAGAVALLVMLLGMKKAFFDTQLVAGARDGLGVVLQMLAGAIGGYVFHRLSLTQKAAKV